MTKGALGRIYQDREVIIREGEIGEHLYVIQDGFVEIVKESGGVELTLAVLGKNDFFGEMAIFEQEPRAATVRALGTARILSLDQKSFLRRIHEDPSLAYRFLEIMSKRLRRLNVEVVELRKLLFEHKIPAEPQPDVKEHFQV
jgi:CRP-like cAMP-binding protein